MSMTMFIHQGNVYRHKSAVEVEYEALSDDAKFIVDMWLRNFGKEPGTPEYEEFKKKAIQRALQIGEMADLGKRVNVAGIRVLADVNPQELLDDLAEAKILVQTALHEAKETVVGVKSKLERSLEWMTELAKKLQEE